MPAVMGSAQPTPMPDPINESHSQPEFDHAPGFVNHTFHLGLPRAPGVDTWGHAALWRNPAARHNAPQPNEWETAMNLMPPSVMHSSATAPNSTRPALLQQQQPLQIPNLQNNNTAYAPLAAHPHSHSQSAFILPHQTHDSTFSFGIQQSHASPVQMSFHQLGLQPHTEEAQDSVGSNRKQWSANSSHGSQTHTASRRGRNTRAVSSPNRQFSSSSGAAHRSRSNCLGQTGSSTSDNNGSNAGGNQAASGAAHIPSVREFNRRISACARRRDLNGALRVLDDLDRTPGVQRNLFTYNAVINALVMCAQHDKAQEFWTEMQETGIEPNLVTYNTMMKSCFGGTDDDVNRAFELVKEMEERGITADRVTLNSLINACVTAGLLREAQRVYEQMRARDIEPDDFTFTTLAKAGASQNNIAMLDALLVHQLHHHSTARNRAASVGNDSETRTTASKATGTHRTSPVAYNTIADAYIRCGHPERALRLLSRLKDLHILQRNVPASTGSDSLDGDSIPVHPDVQTFNVILKALREAGAPAADAFQLLHQLKILGLEADHITLLTLADLCCRREEMALAEGVLHAATEADVREFEKGNSEWRSLCNRGTARDNSRRSNSAHNSHHNNAVNVPGTSSGRRNVNQPKNAKANAALFNALIRGYSSLDPPNVDAAVALYREMQRYLEVYGFAWYAADFVTYTMLVDGFARVGDAARAEAIISEMENAGRANVVAYNAYMKANRASGFKAAVLVLERMKRVGLRPDVVTYNTIIDLLCSEENGAALAEELVRVDMPRNGVRPDLLTFNTLIKGAARVRGSRSDASAALGAAYRWLRELQARGLSPDEFTYQSMVSACAAAGDAPRALEFFRKVEAERAKRSGRTVDFSACSNGDDSQSNSWALGSPPSKKKSASGRQHRQRSYNVPDDVQRKSNSLEGRNSGGRSGKDWMLLPHPAAYIALMRAFLTSNGKHGVESVLLLRDEMVSRGLELGRQGHTAVADAYAERGEFEKVEETLAEMVRKERTDKTGNSQSAGSSEQGLGPVHHCIRMKALCNSDRLDEAIDILPQVKNADAAVFNVLITACARTKDIQRLTIVLRAMEEAHVDPDAITSRAISGMMRNVAKTLRSYDEHFRNTLTKFAAQTGVANSSAALSGSTARSDLQREVTVSSKTAVMQSEPTDTCTSLPSASALEAARTQTAEVPIDSLLNNMTLGDDARSARATPANGLYL